MKKLLLFIVLLILLCPLGIIVPRYFNASEAWGEWSVDSIKEKLGFEPAGMKKDAALYKAPVADYTLGNENDSLVKQSGNYIISGLIGTGIILILTFGAYKYVSRKKTE